MLCGQVKESTIEKTAACTSIVMLTVVLESMADQAQPVIFAMRYCVLACLGAHTHTRSRVQHFLSVNQSHRNTHTRVSVVSE